MAFFGNSDELYGVLKSLFDRIGADPSASQAVMKSKLIMRLGLWSPSAVVLVNGRKNPVGIVYGPTNQRPDLEVEVQADAFHQLMLDKTSFKKMLANGQIKLRGPIWKSFVLEDIFYRGRAVYPQVLLEHGLDEKLE
jgi:hypothetical protein